jgi:hypothetical protein
VFFPRTTLPSVAPIHVRGLRLSLNTPVVATEELPIGPARAAILVHDEPGRGACVTIGIRSLRADRVALYGFDGELADGTALEVALDAALSFAESMGFLFDEDELGDGSAPAKTRCLGLWRDLLGDEAPPQPAPAPAAREEGEELLLDELAEEATEVAIPPSPEEEELAFGPVFTGTVASDPPLEFDPPEGRDRSDASDAMSVGGSAEVAQAAAGGGRRGGSLKLTKFRGGAPRPSRAVEPTAGKTRAKAAAKDAPSAEGRGRAALGRLRLVRRARDGARNRNPIQRLFGAF